MNCKFFTINDLGKEKRLTFQSGVKFLVAGNGIEPLAFRL